MYISVHVPETCSHLIQQWSWKGEKNVIVTKKEAKPLKTCSFLSSRMDWTLLESRYSKTRKTIMICQLF